MSIPQSLRHRKPTNDEMRSIMINKDKNVKYYVGTLIFRWGKGNGLITKSNKCTYAKAHTGKNGRCVFGSKNVRLLKEARKKKK